ncbi:MAG: hypothetical protein GY898_17655 [Proteobacteria bacterium]|nr:hypothetical protein [Pseudomonadota bacterium]
MMTTEEAIAALEGRRTRPVMESSLRSVKEAHTRFLEHGIAAAMVRPPRRGGG